MVFFFLTFNGGRNGGGCSDGGRSGGGCHGEYCCHGGSCGPFEEGGNGLGGSCGGSLEKSAKQTKTFKKEREAVCL